MVKSKCSDTKVSDYSMWRRLIPANRQGYFFERTMDPLLWTNGWMTLPGSAVEIFLPYHILHCWVQMRSCSFCQNVSRNSREIFSFWDFIWTTVCCSCRISSIMYSKGFVLPTQTNASISWGLWILFNTLYPQIQTHSCLTWMFQLAIITSIIDNN